MEKKRRSVDRDRRESINGGIGKTWLSQKSAGREENMCVTEMLAQNYDPHADCA
jgi:hypothetical protein